MQKLTSPAKMASCICYPRPGAGRILYARISSSVSSWRLLMRSLSDKQDSESVLPGRGLVLGGYSKEDGSVELTPVAQNYDSRACGGSLTSMVNRFCPKLKKGDHRVFYGLGDEHVAIAIVNVGPKKPDAPLEDRDEYLECVRAASGAGVLALDKVGVKDIQVEDFGQATASAEGSVLSSFQFDKLKSDPRVPITIKPYNDKSEGWNKGVTLANAQNLSRTLMETPSNLMTPRMFAEAVTAQLSGLSNLKIYQRDKLWIKNQQMGAFLSVAKGSSEEPIFLEAHYQGTAPGEPPLVLVGKGVTFDSGGISIKPSPDMDKMRADMGGAACVVSALVAIATLGLPINVSVVTPLCENLLSGEAYKPGDVVKAMNGKTIQVDNTDAEGRLLLADALHYSHTFSPHTIIDLATLTGAVAVALGTGAAGVFTTDDQLWNALHQSGQLSGDRLWRMPLFKVYSKQMKSNIADLNNIGTPWRYAGACTAAAFLSEFVTSKKWAHIDIAGVMETQGEIPYLPKGMAGRPTRTLIEYCCSLASSQKKL